MIHCRSSYGHPDGHWESRTGKRLLPRFAGIRLLSVGDLLVFAVKRPYRLAVRRACRGLADLLHGQPAEALESFRAAAKAVPPVDKSTPA